MPKTLPRTWYSTKLTPSEFHREHTLVVEGATGAEALALAAVKGAPVGTAVDHWEDCKVQVRWTSDPQHDPREDAPRTPLHTPVGTRVYDKGNGEVVTTSLVRDNGICDGYVVDVEVPPDRLAEFKALGCDTLSWTARQANLYVLDGPREQSDRETLDRCRVICERVRGFTEAQFSGWVRNTAPHLAYLQKEADVARLESTMIAMFEEYHGPGPGEIIVRERIRAEHPDLAYLLRPEDFGR